MGWKYGGRGGRCPKPDGVSYWGKACEVDMELFGLHIPDALATAAVVLYWMAVVVGLLACVMRGWLWGKWRWCFLIWILSIAVGPLFFSLYPDPFSPESGYIFLSAPLLAFFFDRWRKWGLSKIEYLFISLFSLPFLMFLYLVLFLIVMSGAH